MFYSHEVLTNRKYGVATVWLVATLGSKSSLKRITRKQMLDVDVAKACKTIVDPAAPMALRLQGNLLYGVSRVYLQQCGYVLSDAQSAHNTMILMLRSVEHHALNADAGKARPEQLVLQDDPSFLPEFAIPPPELLAELGLGLNFDHPRSGESHTLTPFGSQRLSQSSNVAGYGLVLPSSSPNRPARIRLESDNDGPQGENAMLDIDNLMQLDEPDFMFGEDGDIVELSLGQPVPTTPVTAGGALIHNDAAATAKVRQEHEEGRHCGGQAIIGEHTDMEFPVYRDNLQNLENALSVIKHQHNDAPQIIESSSSVTATMRRRKRAAQVLPKDTALELRNSEILDWNANYLKNMKEAARPRLQYRIKQQAKKNAEHYVWGAGLGDLGRDPFAAEGPLNCFMGDKLFAMFTGLSRKAIASSKHGRDQGFNQPTQGEPSHKRRKIAEVDQESGRGQEDEGLFVVGDEEVELPREAESALDDQQIFSAMPWNISASKRGSSAVPLSGRATMMSDQGRQGSRPGSRMVSASPLLRRSIGQLEDSEALQYLYSDALDEDQFRFAAPTSDPVEAEQAGTQLSLRVREALSAEGKNFFNFVADAIMEKHYHEQARTAAEYEEITFEELLPPLETNKVVASQGFLMLLALGTKNMISVRQSLAFEDIVLKLSEKAKAVRNEEIADVDRTEEHSEDGMVDFVMEGVAGQGPDDATCHSEQAFGPGYSHLQEQNAAGKIAADEDDNHGPLYGVH